MRLEMKTKTLIAALAALVLAVPSMVSAQVPGEVPVQGFLTDGQGVPIDASATLTFRVYDDAVSGTELHSEEKTVSVVAGSFSAYLSPDLSIFAQNTELYLGISVDGGAEMSPRLKLATVPYAAVAGNAANVNWTALQNVPTGLADGDDDTTYSAGSGLEIDANNSIGLPSTCNSGQILRFDGTDWSCASDDSTTYSAGSGVEIDANKNISLNTSCAAGEVLQWDGSAWGCAAVASLTGDQTFGGTVTASNFEYGTLKVGTYDIPAAAFQTEEREDEGWDFSQNHGYGYVGWNDTGSAKVDLYAPVYVPEEAEIGTMTCYFYDNDSSGDISVYAQLKKRFISSQTTSSDAAITMSGSTSGASTTLQKVSDTPSSTTVIRQGDQLWIRVAMTVPSIGSSSRFYGCKVNLLIDRPGAYQ